jgi:hypothetical protein
MRLPRRARLPRDHDVFDAEAAMRHCDEDDRADDDAGHDRRGERALHRPAAAPARARRRNGGEKACGSRGDRDADRHEQGPNADHEQEVVRHGRDRLIGREAEGLQSAELEEHADEVQRERDAGDGSEDAEDGHREARRLPLATWTRRHRRRSSHVGLAEASSRNVRAAMARLIVRSHRIRPMLIPRQVEAAEVEPV